MPRGRMAKNNRIHRRAIASGRSTRGSSGTCGNQCKGKLYKKGEICYQGDLTAEKVIIYMGKPYTIHYHILNNKYNIVGIYPKDSLEKRGNPTLETVEQLKISPDNKPELCNNLMKTFQLCMERPEAYKLMVKAHIQQIIML